MFMKMEITPQTNIFGMTVKDKRQLVPVLLDWEQDVEICYVATKHRCPAKVRDLPTDAGYWLMIGDKPYQVLKSVCTAGNVMTYTAQQLQKIIEVWLA